MGKILLARTKICFKWNTKQENYYFIRNDVRLCNKQTEDDRTGKLKLLSHDRSAVVITDVICCVVN